MAKLFCFLTLFYFVGASNAAQTCYFTNGQVAGNDFPCVDNAGDSASPCCGAGNICLTNGLCFDGLTLNRGSCTDQSWSSDLCTKLCLGALYSGVWPCDDSGGYSCNYGDCSDPFTLTAGRIQINTVLENSLGLDAPTATVTTTLSPTASLGRVAASSPGISTGAAAGIGAGIGVPLLCTTLAATVLFFMERRKRRQLEESVISPQHERRDESKYFQDAHGYTQSAYYKRQPHEMEGFQPRELDNTGHVPELMDRSK